MRRKVCARDRVWAAPSARKLLDKEKTAKIRGSLSRFGQAEGKRHFACKRRHKNIVQTHEYGITTGGEYYLVMDLIEGMGFNYLLETKSRQLDGRRNQFLIQMADALEYVHNQGYLHRDICPRNVMVTKDNIVKMIDFGLTISQAARSFASPAIVPARRTIWPRN